MNGILRILILLAIILGNSTLFAQAGRGTLSNMVDTLVVDAVEDTLITNTPRDTLIASTARDSSAINRENNVAADSTLYYRLVVHYRDSMRHSLNNVRYNLKRTYNKDAFKSKYDPFQEKMKEPWLGDILRDIFFR